MCSFWVWLFYPNAITVRCTVKSCFSFVLLYTLKKEEKEKEKKKKKEEKKEKKAN